MGSFSNAAENLILDHALGKTSWTMPANVYLALCTVLPTDADTGATLTEANYTGYARKAVAAADLNAASGGSISNGNAITFAACTAGSSTIVGWALVTSSSGAGTIIAWGSMTSKLIDTSNTPPTVNAGALVVTLD